MITKLNGKCTFCEGSNKKLPVELRSVWIPSDIPEYVIIWPLSVAMDARLKELYYSYFP